MLNKKMLSFGIVLMSFLSVSTSYASLYTVNIEGLDEVQGSGLSSFVFDFNVSGDFISNISILGDAIPTTGDWKKDKYSVPSKFGAADWGPLFDEPLAPIKNGTIITIDYSGTIYGFNQIKFSDLGGSNMYPGLISLKSSTANGATFTAAPVPVPAAAWLLGSGLLGLMGLRRKGSASCESVNIIE